MCSPRRDLRESKPPESLVPGRSQATPAGLGQVVLEKSEKEEHEALAQK